LKISEERLHYLLNKKKGNQFVKPGVVSRLQYCSDNKQTEIVGKPSSNLAQAATK